MQDLVGVQWMPAFNLLNDIQKTEGYEEKPIGRIK